MEQIRVDCYCGYRGEETPRRFWMNARCIEVRKVVDQWLATDHRYFKILCTDGDLYILRHDPRESRWELTFFSKQGIG